MLFGDGMKPPNSKYAGPTDEPTLHRTRRRPRGLLLQSFPPLFCIYIFALILLPTGQFFGANIKVILFVPLIMAASAEYCRLSSTSYLTMGGLVMIPTLVFFWVLVGLTYRFDPAISFLQYKDLIVTVATCWVISLFGSIKKDGYRVFLRLVIGAIFVTSCIKVLIFVYALVEGRSVDSIIVFISHAFGVQLMSMDLDDIGGRIQFISDSLIPLCLFAVFGLRPMLKVSQKFALLFSVLAFLPCLPFHDSCGDSPFWVSFWA
jgi:hypothetical protein